MNEYDAEIIGPAVKLVWEIPGDYSGNILSHPAFVQLSDLCINLYSSGRRTIWSDFALSNALASLGMPYTSKYHRSSSTGSSALATAALSEAFKRKVETIVHLCPLDLIGDIPTLNFGGSSVKKYSACELGSLIGLERLETLYGTHAIDIKNLACFHWLVVREERVLKQPPAARATPVLFEDLEVPQDNVVPHKGRLPASVELALFFLIQAPWEEWTGQFNADWRGFEVPWVYTCTNDLFVRPILPPSAESLSWTVVPVPNRTGGYDENVVPIQFDLDEAARIHLASSLTDSAWVSMQVAVQSTLFEVPLVHFFVKAYLSDGIDEVMAHMTSIEAALGLKSDYGKKDKTESNSIKNLSASDRVALRICGLLGDHKFAKAYQALFDLRSEFLHGRPMQPISNSSRLQARALSRLVVGGMVCAGAQRPYERAQYLSELLIRGVGLRKAVELER